MRRRKYVARNRAFTYRRAAILGGVLLLVAGAAITAVFLLKGLDPVRSAKKLPFGAAANYEFTGDGFLYASEQTLYYYNLDDDAKNYSVQLPSQDVRLMGSPSLAGVYNEQAVQIIGMDFPIEFSGKLLAGKCGETHVAVLKDDSGQGVLQVFDGTTGKQVQQIAQTAPLVDFGFFSGASQTLWTLEMNDSASLPLSIISTYDLTNARTTGVMSVQNQLVDKVLFSAESIFVVGTNHIIRYDMVGKNESYRAMVYGWEYCDDSPSGGKRVFLLTPRGSSGWGTARLVTLADAADASLSTATVQLPADTLNAFLAGGQLYAFTADTLSVFSQSGKLVQKSGFDEAITGAVKLSENRILLIRDGELYLMTL